MKQSIMLFGFSLLLIFVACHTVAEAEEGSDRYSLWLGAHYTDFGDYGKKVGEYRVLQEHLFPEFKFDYMGIGGGDVFRLNADYFDYENFLGRARAIISDQFRGEVRYRSTTEQGQQDLLRNMTVRESVGGNPGGKMITHELMDAGVDYSTYRREVTSEMDLLVAHKNDVRLLAAHRFILEKGNDQKVANTHCFSCHLTSHEADVEKRTHQIEAGLEAEVSSYDVGYQFGYRKFESNAPAAFNYYDNARHPVNGGAQEEFGSRLIYEDATLPFGVYPETEKMSHKVRFKGDLASGRFAGAAYYRKVENSQANYAGTNLEIEAYGGSLNYTTPLSRRSRIIAKASGGRIKNDDPFIDVPLWREGRPGPQTDFDYYRYSSLDRKTINASVEVIGKLGRSLTAGVLGGYDYVLRYDYPELGSEYATKTYIGQLKLNYRNGLRYSLRGKYRFEKTSDPFTSGRGLFERRGREELQRDYPGFPFFFYFQREDLRYQSITTAPTDRHEIDVMATYRPTSKINITFGLKAGFDKNNDLDSLDVEHTSLQPNMNITATPNPKWTFSGGYTYGFNKSRGPVAVALFDG